MQNTVDMADSANMDPSLDNKGAMTSDTGEDAPSFWVVKIKHFVVKISYVVVKISYVVAKI